LRFPKPESDKEKHENLVERVVRAWFFVAVLEEGVKQLDPLTRFKVLVVEALSLAGFLIICYLIGKTEFHLLLR